MNPATKQYSRQEKEKMIWKHKHPDFKSASEDGRNIMLPANLHTDHGQMANLSLADDSLVDVLFEDALKAEAREVKRNIFVHVFDGKYPHLDSAAANQWSSSFDDMRSFAEGVEMDESARKRAIAEIDRFEAKFNGQPEQKMTHDHDSLELGR